MSTLTHSHVRRQPVQHRITVMETAEDQHYYGRTYDSYPYRDGTIVLYGPDGREQRVPFMGLYLVEELDSNGVPTRTFELLTPEVFKEQYVELGNPALEYGYRAVGGVNVFFHPMTGDLESARTGVSKMQQMYPLGKFEVVSRPVGSDDEWTVVGR